MSGLKFVSFCYNIRQFPSIENQVSHYSLVAKWLMICLMWFTFKLYNSIFDLARKNKESKNKIFSSLWELSGMFEFG